jgi:signal transduction histidine kinase
VVGSSREGSILTQAIKPTKFSLRNRILISVGALVLLSLLASTLSLHRVVEVSRNLDAINRVSVPLGRLLAQMRSDSELLKREIERRLGSQHWNDPHWRPQPIPGWIQEVLEGEILKMEELLARGRGILDPASEARWQEWLQKLKAGLRETESLSSQLHLALESKQEDVAHEVSSQLTGALEGWIRELQWGVGESERSIRRTFEGAEDRISQLRAGLQLVLIVVLILSFLMFWLGERALRPLAMLTAWVREVTARGLRKEDKALLALGRNDEVGQLAQEFHRMATALLEREKTVGEQKERLLEQNQLLKTTLSQQLELQSKLRAAENLAAVGRMSAQVAHEVRNPLHAIGLEAEIALESAVAAKDPALKQSLHSILEAVARLDAITENYLRLSRLSSGRRERVSLDSLLQNMLALYAPAFEAAGIHVDWKRDSDRPYACEGDRALLEQAIGNLMRNAIQAMEPLPAGRERKIEIRLSALESGGLCIAVEDSGPGISPEVEDKLFTPFFTTKAQGTGLGLSFVKRVIEDHGGHVEFERGRSSGACVRLVLPESMEVLAGEERPHAEA